jgi:haloalkane dehalogenase
VVSRIFNSTRRRGSPASPGEPLEKATVEVLGQPIAFTETGSGHPLVFVHGGIGSSYLWRGVIPRQAPEARCIAVDLIGTGDSGRLGAPKVDPATRRAIPHGWQEHVAYLDAFLDAIDVGSNITLVLHGWGSIVGLEWARTNERRLRGICHLEAITRPLAWHEFPESLRESIRRARSTDGRGYVMDSDECFERLLETQVLQPLAPEVQAEYWRAFGHLGEPRRALLSAFNLIPANGKPQESAALVKTVGTWFKQTQIPKLLVLGQPGYLVTGRTRDLALRLPNQTVVKVPGVHLLPEESPEALSLFLSLWLRHLPLAPAELTAHEKNG